MTFRRLSLTQRRVGLGVLVGAAFALLLSPSNAGQLNGFSKHTTVARYAPDLAATSFHPIDGARHVRALGHERLARLIAYHSSARWEAEALGLADELASGGDPLSLLRGALPVERDPGGGQGEDEQH